MLYKADHVRCTDICATYTGTCCAMARILMYSASAEGECEGAATFTSHASPVKLSEPLRKQVRRFYQRERRQSLYNFRRDFPYPKACFYMLETNHVLIHHYKPLLSIFPIKLNFPKDSWEQQQMLFETAPVCDVINLSSNLTLWVSTYSHIYAACVGLCIIHTFTGSRVAENASCKAQLDNLHISSVKTGPPVTRTYLNTNRNYSNKTL